ncbi:Uncharacterised protein [Klebsiella variicola]|nr:Uncharacterised protein [Klebsiella variicola]
MTRGFLTRFCYFMPLGCYRFKGGYWRVSGLFGNTLLCGIDILLEQFADTVTLLASIRQTNFGVGP